MHRGPSVRGGRLAAGAVSLVALPLAMSACTYAVVPDRAQVLGTWVNFQTYATLDLAEDGTCQVTGLPDGVAEGSPPPYGEPSSADCTWQFSDGGQVAPALTIRFVQGGGMAVAVLDGPKLGVRQDDGDRFFEFERALL